jgi:hypothetical protein
MENDWSGIEKPVKLTLAFECDGCSESFESLERLRQHQVDCKSDESEEWL